MIQYILTNTALSILCLGLIFWLKRAPAGVQLCIVLIALFGWLVPVQNFQIKFKVPSKSPVYTYFRVMETVDQVQAKSLPIPLAKDNHKPWWIALVLLVGLTKWTIGWTRIRRQLVGMRQDSYLLQMHELPFASKIPVRIIPKSYDASAVGYFKPEIWIGSSHLQKTQFESLVHHEWLHISHGDNYLRFFLFGMDCLFWWNPLIHFLTARARLYSEMRVDMRCQQRDSDYVSYLAEAILIEHHRPIFASGLANHFFHTKKTNLFRIKMLEGRKTMLKISHIMLVLFSLAMGVFLFARADESLDNKSTKKTIARVGEEGVTPPRFISRVPPVYPEEAKKAGIDGYVILDALLGENGEVRDVKVLRGIEDQQYGFEEAAIEAIKHWHYIPGKIDGEPVDVRLTLKIDFKLDGDGEPRPGRDENSCRFIFKRPGEEWNSKLMQSQMRKEKKDAYVMQPFMLEISLNRDGIVSNYEIQEELTMVEAELVEAVENAIKGWRFDFGTDMQGWVGQTGFTLELTEEEWINAGLPTEFRRLEYEGPMIQGINVEKVSIRELAEFFAQQAEKKLVFDSEFNDLMGTYKFEDIKWGMALEIITSNAGIYYRIKGDDLIVGSKSFVYGI